MNYAIYSRNVCSVKHISSYANSYMYIYAEILLFDLCGWFWRWRPSTACVDYVTASGCWSLKVISITGKRRCREAACGVHVPRIADPQAQIYRIFPSQSHVSLLLFLVSIFPFLFSFGHSTSSPKPSSPTRNARTDGDLFGKNRNRNRHRVNKALGKYLERDEDNYGPDHNLGLGLGLGMGMGLGLDDDGDLVPSNLVDEKRKRFSSFRERDEQFGKSKAQRWESRTFGIPTHY